MVLSQSLAFVLINLLGIYFYLNNYQQWVSLQILIFIKFPGNPSCGPLPVLVVLPSRRLASVGFVVLSHERPEDYLLVPMSR